MCYGISKLCACNKIKYSSFYTHYNMFQCFKALRHVGVSIKNLIIGFKYVCTIWFLIRIILPNAKFKTRASVPLSAQFLFTSPGSLRTRPENNGATHFSRFPPLPWVQIRGNGRNKKCRSYKLGKQSHNNAICVAYLNKHLLIIR